MSKVVKYEKVFTMFKTDKESKEEQDELYQTSAQITTDVRHYCSRCQRKRDESFMELTGKKSRFQKPLWQCRDTVTCKRVAKLKGLE